MKVILRTILVVTCICIFLAENASSLGSTIVGDVLIETQDNGTLYCDSLICPKGTSHCHVTKKNDPNDFRIIVRHRRCIGSNGVVLQEQKLNEPNKYLGIVNVNVVSGGLISNSVRPLTAEEKKELNEFLEKTQQKVQSQIGGTLDQVYTSLGPLLDGSFATNLQNQILGNL